jgi:hypothetical protein
VPREGDTVSTVYSTPYQAVGARGVNNLASKLAMTMLPPSSSTTSCFRLDIDEIQLEQIAGQKGLRGEVDEALGRVERAINLKIDASTARTVLGEAFKYLLVAGNVLLMVEKNSADLRMFRMDRFVVKRSPTGQPIEMITHETLSASEIPEAYRARVAKAGAANDTEKLHQLYTRTWLGTREGQRVWYIEQQLDDVEVAEARGFEPEDKCRWFVLAPMLIPGEDYARSFVEDIIGDLMTLEGLSRALAQGSAAAAKIVHLVKPNSSTDVDELNNAESGDYVTGDTNDIGTHQLEKYADLQWVGQHAQVIEKRLEMVFLLHTAIQRNGERVTAEEIRTMSAELEQGLGGIYSSLSQSFQRRYITKVMHQMTMAQELPQLPDKAIKLIVTTGVDSLGRSADLMKLDQFIQGDQTCPPEVKANVVNWPDYFRRRAAYLGIDPKGLVKTEEELQAEQQQAMQAQMAQEMAPIAAQQATQQP